jgi:hypothetical protein
MRKLILLLVLAPYIVFAQTTSNVLKKLGPDPLKVLDTVKISDDVFSKLNANDIATLTIMYDTSAMKKYGSEAKDGAVIIVTKRLARKQYVAFLRRKSIQFDSIYNKMQNDSTFQYIINDKPKNINYEGELSMLDDDHFISLAVLTADDLKNKYNITNKSYGILIYYKPRKNLSQKK